MKLLNDLRSIIFDKKMKSDFIFPNLGYNTYLSDTVNSQNAFRKIKIFQTKQKLPNDHTLREPLEKALREYSTNIEKKVLCSECKNYISDESMIEIINGSSHHTFINPANIIYDIICFKTAPGCIHSEKFTEEFTWFPGFSWAHSFCGSCFKHNGWFYSSFSHSFFGLIKEKLIFEIYS